jgi:hypothetical protein
LSFLLSGARRKTDRAKIERQGNIMNNELDRIKQDLKTMQAVIRREPEFDRRHVWVSIGWGVWGVVFILFGLIPHVVPQTLLAFILIALLFVLPHLLPRLVCRDLPAVPPMGDKQVNSPSVGLLILALSLGIIFWVSRMNPAPRNMVLALVFLMAASWSLFTAWGRPWWRGLLAFAAAFGAAGFAMPFLPKELVGPVMGAAMICGGFGGAAILHLQLKAYDAHGKAAH